MGISARILSAFILICTLSNSVNANDVITIKMSILAPEGSAWVNEFKNMNEELKKTINGRVQFKIYPGGIMGDDDVVLRKVRVGQLDGACLTSRGMYKIYPDFRVLTLPGLFKSDAEIDHVIRELTPDIVKAYQDLGFMTLGITGVGFTFMYSQKDIQNTDDLKRSKAWLWENDPVMQALYTEANVTPISLGVGDVLTALQTGLLDTVFNTPTGMLSLQWFSKINYMTDLPLSYAFGGFLVSEKSWQRIPDDCKDIIRETVNRHMNQLTDQIRIEDKRAIEVITGRGVKLSSPSPDFRQSVEGFAGKTRQKLTQEGSSSQFIEKINQILSEMPRSN